MNRAVIELGSNIDPRQHMHDSVDVLRTRFTVSKVSSFVTTAPIGAALQADYLNGAVLLETSLEYIEFLRVLRTIESELGRVRGPDRFGPRTIDLDLIVWNSTIVNNDYYDRDFVRETVEAVLPGTLRLADHTTAKDFI